MSVLNAIDALELDTIDITTKTFESIYYFEHIDSWAKYYKMNCVWTTNTNQVKMFNWTYSLDCFDSKKHTSFQVILFRYQNTTNW